MRRVNGLKVIENPYCYAGWETVRTEAGQCFHSQKKTFCQRRDTELYRLCGVYHRAGVPAEIEEVDGGGAEEEFCLRVTRNLSDSVYRGVKAGKAVLIAGMLCWMTEGIAFWISGRTSFRSNAESLIANHFFFFR